MGFAKGCDEPLLPPAERVTLGIFILLPLSAELTNVGPEFLFSVLAHQSSQEDSENEKEGYGTRRDRNKVHATLYRHYTYYPG